MLMLVFLEGLMKLQIVILQMESTATVAKAVR